MRTPNSSLEAGSGQDKGIELPGDTDSPSVAQSVLVCGSAGPSSGFSQSSPAQERSSQATPFFPVSQSSRVVATPRVDVIKQRLRDQGFSEEVSSRIAKPIGVLLWLSMSPNGEPSVVGAINRKLIHSEFL